MISVSDDHKLCHNYKHDYHRYGQLYEHITIINYASRVALQIVASRTIVIHYHHDNHDMFIVQATALFLHQLAAPLFKRPKWELTLPSEFYLT
jgi:hypothetical protein